MGRLKDKTEVKEDNANGYRDKPISDATGEPETRETLKEEAMTATPSLEGEIAPRRLRGY